MDREKSTQQSTAMQKEWLETCQETSRYWLDRAQSEMAVWADLGSKLATTRSVTAPFDAYAKCVAQQMKMTAEDGQRLLADCQRVTQKIMRSFSDDAGPKRIS